VAAGESGVEESDNIGEDEDGDIKRGIEKGIDEGKDGDIKEGTGKGTGERTNKELLFKKKILLHYYVLGVYNFDRFRRVYKAQFYR